MIRPPPTLCQTRPGGDCGATNSLTQPLDPLSKMNGFSILRHFVPVRRVWHAAQPFGKAH